MLVALVGELDVGAVRRRLRSCSPLAVVQGLAVAAALLIHEDRRGEARGSHGRSRDASQISTEAASGWFPKDAGLWAFVAAMVLFHAANAPGGVYLGLFLKRDLHAPERMLAYAFVVSMVAWMLVVWPAGWLADRWGRKPLLIAGWTIMAVRLGLVAVVQSPWLAVANQALDGLGNGLFAVLAAAWVTDRLADPRRSGEAQVIVGSCLVLGSALGPAAAGFLVGPLGYRGLFAALAGARRRRDGDRRLLRPGDAWRGTTSSSTAGSSTRWPRRPTSRRSRERRSHDRTSHSSMTLTPEESSPVTTHPASIPLVSTIFGLTYLALALGKVPGLRIDRAGIALVGAAAMLACGVLSMHDAARAVDYETIVLLFGMMVVVSYLRLAGFFALATERIAARFSGPLTLLAVTIGLSGVLSAFLVNDVVCVALTPLVLHLCQRLKRPPIPYLVGLATASNIGSVATITGNPQNIIIGSLSHISYLRFAARLAPVAADRPGPQLRRRGARLPQGARRGAARSAARPTSRRGPGSIAAS